jgi:hypothetical protein
LCRRFLGFCAFFYLLISLRLVDMVRLVLYCVGL